MSFKSKVTAAAAALTLVGGVGMAGALTADPRRRPRRRADTPASTSSASSSARTSSPNYVVDVLRQGEKVGQPIILFRTANYDPAEDFDRRVPGHGGRLLRGRSLVSAALDAALLGGLGASFPNSPYGVGERVRASASGPRPSWAWPGRVRAEGVTLQPCGESANTVWILDFQDSRSTFIHGGYIPLINGSDTNFSHPYVLNYPGNGAYPTDKPRPQLTTWTLSKYSNGTVFDNQMWGANFGVLP